MRRVTTLAPMLGVLLLVFAVFASPASAGPSHQGATPAPVQAIILVERAVVFSAPARTADAITYLFERERAPILAQTADGVWLLTEVEGLQGWILRVQVDIEGDLTQVAVMNSSGPAPTVTITPFQGNGALPTTTPTPLRTPGDRPGLLLFTPTPISTLPSAATSDATPGDSPSNEAQGLFPFLPGEPPPITVDLPPDWRSIDVIGPYRLFEDSTARQVAFTVYSGPLPDGTVGYIYLYWGYPNTMDMGTREYRLWSDAVQLLRFSLVGEECALNLNVYEQRMFMIGVQEGIGALYQVYECLDQPDTAGWFATLRAYDEAFTFYVAVEPPAALTANSTFLQNILDTVTFLPPGAELPSEAD